MSESLEKILFELEEYIAAHYVPSEENENEETLQAPSDKPAEASGIAEEKGAGKGGAAESSLSLDDLIGEVGPTFHEKLFDLIANSGMTDVEVYKRADIDRKFFSKIRNNPAYHPRKDVILALAISLRLSISETEDLLSRAEYAFSPGRKSDVIIRYFIERGIYDMQVINLALHDHGLPILGEY